MFNQKLAFGATRSLFSLPASLLLAFYDWLEAAWLSPRVRRLAERSLVFLFLASLVVIELSIRNWLPAGVAELVPKKHLYAIQVAFGALVLYEVTGLIFGLVKSVANSLGQQLEIFSLILLRGSFEELIDLDEPVQWDRLIASAHDNPLLHLAADAFGALIVFVMLGLYYRMQRHQPISQDASDRASFTSAKKIVAIALLAGYVAIAFVAAKQWIFRNEPPLFFEAFYTMLIFCDLLIMLISIRYTSTYRVVFRNAAFAVATILIRLALTAPPYYNVIIGITAATFSVCLTIAYNTFAPIIRQMDAEPSA